MYEFAIYIDVDRYIARTTDDKGIDLGLAGSQTQTWLWIQDASRHGFAYVIDKTVISDKID